jgi:hypothetical protein
MAGFSLLALLDDSTSVLDDVALMTKMAARKTAGVLGDDLALNAQQMTGLAAGLVCGGLIRALMSSLKAGMRLARGGVSDQ